MATDDGAIDELYAAPLDEFTSRRNALSKELASAGDKEQAAEVKRLAKPSAAAWTLNQLARSDPTGIGDLLDTADRMRAAQRGEGGDLRSLNADVRSHVTKCLAEAQAITESSGRQVTQTLKNIVTQSLMAAAGDEEAGAALRAGRLSRELQPGGFDAAGSNLFVSAPQPERSPHDAEAEERAEQLAEEADAAEREAKKLATEADRAEREAKRARTRAKEAASSAAAKRAKADAVAGALKA
ncbi:MAG: hypothetical protein QOD46_251 [Actinomycetota bacterium]|nr:hypothetical protein [Actinomycetota bacterium]